MTADYTAQSNWTTWNGFQVRPSVRESAIENQSIPDRFTPLKGFRAWWLARTLGNLELVSLGFGVAWSREGVEAKCFKGQLPSIARAFSLGEGPLTPSRLHSAPNKDCACGVYAVKTFSLLVEERAVQSCHELDWIQDRLVLGAVDLWGKVVIHERGYRAQFARPTELWTNPTFSGWVDAFRVKFQIPVSAPPWPQILEMAGT